VDEAVWLTPDDVAIGKDTVVEAALHFILNSVRPVADGSFGVPMKASRGNRVGTAINLNWDVATCSSTDHHLIYGNLATVSSLAVIGCACNLGTTGTATWATVPPGSLWFVIVATTMPRPREAGAPTETARSAAARRSPVGAT
jgi:hypothetical protein